jgi:hypothetical protein
MVLPRRRGGHNHNPCPYPRRAVLPPAALLLLFLLAAVALLYFSPPPLSDHPALASSRHRSSHALVLHW